MKSPIPPNLLTAISSIRCPLPNGPPVPMCYEPLDRLAEIRRSSSAQESILAPHMLPLLEDIPSTIHELSIGSKEGIEQDNVILSLALTFLGNGCMDEAHDLVTPLSWSQDTHFSYGPSRTAQIDPETFTMASYIHALIHRREGFAMGEYNMMGYANANYWSRVAMTSNGVNSIPFGKIRNHILSLVSDNMHSKSEKSETFAQKWCQERIVDEGGPEDEEYWESRALHELCAQVTKGDIEDERTAELRTFAEKAAEIELRVLIETCLKRAGYDCGEDVLTATKAKREDVILKDNIFPNIDPSAAQRVANKLSSAHIDSFRSNHFVLLRNTLATLPNNLSSNSLQSPENIFSVAAGIACRLLHSPACCFIEPSQSSSYKGVNVFLPGTEEERVKCATFLENLNSVTYGGGDIMVGDAYVVLKNDSSIDASVSSFCYAFAPCEKEDVACCFVDRFHGTRGETPTTVLQWSKGTIFEMIENNK